MQSAWCAQPLIAATLNPAGKAIHTFVAVGGDHTASAGA